MSTIRRLIESIASAIASRRADRLEAGRKWAQQRIAANGLQAAEDELAANIAMGWCGEFEEGASEVICAAFDAEERRRSGARKLPAQHDASC